MNWRRRGTTRPAQLNLGTCYCLHQTVTKAKFSWRGAPNIKSVDLDLSESDRSRSNFRFTLPVLGPKPFLCMPKPCALQLTVCMELCSPCPPSLPIRDTQPLEEHVACGDSTVCLSAAPRNSSRPNANCDFYLLLFWWPPCRRKETADCFHGAE